MHWFCIATSAAVSVALLLLPANAAASQRDSLAYMMLRDSVAADSTYPDEYRGYIAASDELAADGLFREAYELLEGLFADLLLEQGPDGGGEDSFLEKVSAVAGGADTAAPADSHVLAAEPQTRVWRISTTASYDRFDDTYMTWLDEDSLDSAMAALDEIDDQPFNGNLRISLDWQPGPDALERLSPCIYVSNTRLRAGLTAAGGCARGVLRYEIEAEGEKRLGEDYGDSSDVVKGGIELEATTRPLDRPVTVSLPVRFETEQYRTERPQYASFHELSAEPILELESRDFSRHVAVSFSASWQNYARARDDDDRIAYGPRLSADLFGHIGNALAQAAWIWERYPHRPDPCRRTRLEGDVQAVLRPLPWLELGLAGSGFRDSEQYRDQSLFAVQQGDTVDSLWSIDETWRTIDADYPLTGYGGEARPSVRLRHGSGIAFEAGLGYEYARFPEKTTHDTVRLYDTLYISESYSAWEPKLTLYADMTPVYASLSFACRREDIIDERFLEDNTTLEPSMQLNWRIASWLTLDMYADYQHRLFPDDIVENNVSVSLTLRARP